MQPLTPTPRPRTPLGAPLTALALATGLLLSPGLQAAPAGKPMTPTAKAAADAAAAERIKALEGKLDQSLALIQQLQQRVAELEAARKPAAVAAAAPAPAPAVSETRVAELEQQVRDLTSAAAAPRTQADAGVPLHGFLDVGYQRFSTDQENQRSGHRLGTFDIYLAPQFGNNIRSLVELAFEYDGSGGLATDLERLQIGYAFDNGAVLWAGRFHTPYGYWNTAFHHGAQIQTSLTRPRFLGFEDNGGIVPAHTVGLWLNGSTRTSLGKLGYDAYLGNGNRISEGVLDFQAAGDDNHQPSVGFNLSLSPASLSELTVGVFGMRQRVSGSREALSGGARSQFLGAYAAYDGDSLELLTEVYRFGNTDLANGQNRHSTAGYLQTGWRLGNGFTPYLRYEKASLNQADPYFLLQESGASYRQHTVGLRYDLDPRAALKVEWARQRDERNGLGSVNALRAQYAIRF